MEICRPVLLDFSFGLRARNMSAMGDRAMAKIHTHGHDVHRGQCSFLVVLIDLLICSMKGRGKRLIFWTVSMTEPCSVKGFKCQNGQMKSWNIVRWECLLSIISMLRTVRLLFVGRRVNAHWATQGRCWLATILHLWTWAHIAYHALQSLVLPNEHYQQKHQRTMENKWWTQIFIWNLLCTFFSLWAQSSIKYVDDHHTFISSISWTGCPLFALTWIVLHISFRFDDEHSWPRVSDNIFLRRSTNTYLDYNCPYQPHLITGCWYMCIWLFRVEMWWLATGWDEHLCCQIDYMCETAVVCE